MQTFLLCNIPKSVRNKKVNKNVLSNNEKIYYDNLFDIIDYDDYDLSLIFNKSYNSIKIKHKSKILLFRKVICVLGVLCNDEGMRIEKEMLNWLIPEFDVYCVYQKYPGILYEYPALRFAQWLSQSFNISIILYVHTKGAYHKGEMQEKVREFWKYEFTYNKKKYIKLLKNNFCDVSLPFRRGIVTWYNGMLISNRAFNLINKIEYDPKNRWHYESLFRNSNKINYSIRIKGVIDDNILPNRLERKILLLLNNYKNFYTKRKSKIIERIFIVFLFLQFCIYLKVLNLKKKFNHKKVIKK